MKILILLLFFCASIFPSRTQTPSKKEKARILSITPEYGQVDIFGAMDFECIPVEGLSIREVKSCHWKPYLSIGRFLLKSDDKYFISAIEIQFMYKEFDRSHNTVAARNKLYFYMIRNDLIEISGKYDRNYRDKFSMKDLKENVNYHPDAYAKNVFNADTVISYSLPVKRVGWNSHVKRKYTNCEVLLIHKNDLGPIVFYSFFTKKGYKNREKYLDKLEKSVRFID